MKVTLTAQQIVDRRIRKVIAIRSLPSGHVKKGDEVLALHKMRIFVPMAGTQYEALEMDGQLFGLYFKDPEPIIMI